MDTKHELPYELPYERIIRQRQAAIAAVRERDGATDEDDAAMLQRIRDRAREQR